MPDTVEANIDRLLKGQCLEGDEADLCDYTLEDQNAALETQGIQPSVSPDFKPVVRETVTYIVAVVLINDKDEVLMMQEAKQCCAGKWYLPAGRVNKSETLVDAASREVLEETGLNVQCTTLLMIESAGGSWVRFVMTGLVTGGLLKTPEGADKESLQARWVGKIAELELRSADIVHLIERARAYRDARRQSDETWHRDQLPSLRSHTHLLLRLVVTVRKRATNRVHVLLSERDRWHLPVCQMHPAKSLHSTLRRFMVDLFGAQVPVHKPHGLLAVEHDARNGDDGLCLTLLVSFRNPLEEVPIIGKCVWHEISKELGDRLMSRVGNRNSTLPVHVIR